MTLRVVSYNIHCQELSSKILDALQPFAADIILFQEIEEYTPGSLVKVAAKYKYSAVYAPSRDFVKKTGTHGIAILSRFPIKSFQIFKLPFKNLRFRSRDRIALEADIQLPHRKLKVYNVHLDSRLNIQERLDQLSPIKSAIEQADSEIILGGDFNTTPFYLLKNVLPVSYVNQRERLKNYLQDWGLKTKHIKLRYITRYGLFMTLLNGIYTSNLEIVDHGVFKEIKLSDHVPLWVDMVDSTA